MDEGKPCSPTFPKATWGKPIRRLRELRASQRALAGGDYRGGQAGEHATSGTTGGTPRVCSIFRLMIG